MYLKRLEIQGFKSFAPKTVLDFLPPKDGRFSITAIVGPNGSGKSNISDAIRWVMGEQSMKNIRGKKSEDVIFAGSETKGQLGVAEVTLVLDNSDKRVLEDYSEIVVTRRFDRSGEGEYLINNKQVRLFDIHLLLAQAQFAQGSYSVVGQGMIDKLLVSSPADRKDFLDEAAGIKEFQIKQHQAELKLKHTEENMIQAERLLAEVEPRLKILARQVKKLEKRQEVEMELREVQEKYYGTIYNKNKTDFDAVRADLNVVEENYRKMFKELETVQTELAELARASTRQEVFNELQVRYREAVRVKNDLERELAVLQGSLQAEYRQSGQQNVGWLTSKVAELKSNHDKLKDNLSGIEDEAEQVGRKVGEERRRADDLSMSKAAATVNISRLQTLMMNDQSEQNYRELAGLTAVKSVMENRHKFGKVHGLVAELGEVAEDHRLALEVAAGANLSSIVVEDDEVARLAIDYLREQRLGVATFLPLNKVRGRETSNDIQNLLSERDVYGLALSLINFDDKFYEIFSFIFGNTLVVKDLITARRIGIGAARMVTLTGDLVEKTGMMKGGYRHRKYSSLTFSNKTFLNQDDRLAEYQNQIKIEQDNLAELDKKFETSQAALMKLEVETQTVAARREMVSADLSKAEKELADLENELSLLQTTPEQYGEHLQKLSVNKDELVINIEKESKAVEKISQEIEHFNQKEEEKKQRVFALQEVMQKKQEEINKILNRRNDLKVEAAKLETKQESLREEVQANMGEAVESIVNRAPELVEINLLEQLADQIQKLKYQLSLIGGIDNEVIAEHDQTKEKFDFLSGQLSDLHSATDNLKKMITELDELMKKKRSVAFKKIRKEFDRYFQILFDGGSAKLEEIYGVPESGEETEGELVGVQAELPAPVAAKPKEEVLTGIDIIANPPGKKIKNINALSGGERTLTSIALICAILNYNPSPFVVLDEVEAALDEANTMRFTKIMQELSAQSQFIVITHNRVTMHSANALYGVVMKADGISNMLSVKMEDVPQFEEKTEVAT